MQQYDQTRKECTEAARNALQAAAHGAAVTLTDIMQDDTAPAQTRINAATEVLRQNLKYTEYSELEQRITELERWKEGHNEL